MSDFKLSDGDAVLTFEPHGWNAAMAMTATFDVRTTKVDAVSHDDTLPPDYQRRGVGVYTNIDRATARALRDALDAWLRAS